MRRNQLHPWRHSLAAALLALLTTHHPAHAQAPNHSFVDVPNARLFVTDTGGPGIPVVLLHPTTGTSDIFEPVLPAFTQAGFRVITLDKPGWGRSEVRAGQAPVSLAEDLDALFTQLNLPRVHLVGVANGGYAALDFAAWRPERVASLVLSNTGLGLKGDPDGEAFRRNAAIPGFDKLPAEIREMSPTYRGLHPDGVARWKAIEAQAARPGAVEPPMRTPNTLEKVAGLRMKLLVIAGDVDLTTPSGAIRLWAKHLTVPYDFVLVPEAGHALSWEQPEAFAGTVIGFLKKQGR